MAGELSQHLGKSVEGEISASSIVIMVNGDKVAHGLVKDSSRPVGVWKRVELFTNVGRDSRF
jgi:hypothetical protein